MADQGVTAFTARHKLSSSQHRELMLLHKDPDYPVGTCINQTMKSLEKKGYAKCEWDMPDPLNRFSWRERWVLTEKGVAYAKGFEEDEAANRSIYASRPRSYPTKRATDQFQTQGSHLSAEPDQPEKDVGTAITKQTIEFYRANEKPYGAFSNLYRCSVEVAGIKFPTVEHAYQSLKPRDSRVRDWLLSAPAPSLVALCAHSLPSNDIDPTEIMGRTADALLGFHTRPGWSRLRYPWMLECIRAKFSQHEELRDLLLATGDADLIEAGRIDDDAGRRWGVVNGRGQNYLGRMLMRIRGELGGLMVPDDDLDERLIGGSEALSVALGVKAAA
jgi:N-glycosidase YbiA